MNVQPLERHDVKGVRWEFYETTFRVDFWHQLPAPPGSAQETMGYKQDSFRLADVADVTEVLEWARQNAAGRLFVIHAEVKFEGDTGIVRVLGADPTHN